MPDSVADPLRPRPRPTTRQIVAPCRAIPAACMRYPLIFNDLSFPNDVIRREHSPPLTLPTPLGR